MFVLRDEKFVPKRPVSLSELKMSEAEFKQQFRETLAAELEMMTIAKEARISNVSADFADQIGLTEKGQLVFVEFKRGKAEARAFNQLLNYLLYARSLRTLDVIGLTSNYYAAEGWPRSEAEFDICNLTGQPDPDRLALNIGDRPRGVLIAEDFADPVYHLVLEMWDYVQIDLYRLELWQSGDEPICQLTPISRSEMSKMNSAKCAKLLGRNTPDSKEVHLRFWSRLRAAFRTAGMDRFVNRKASDGPMMLRFWSGKEGVGHYLQLDHQEAAVGMYFPKSQCVLRALYERREPIHQCLGPELEWRMDFKRFGIYREASIFCESQWDYFIAWMLDTFRRFEAAVDPELQDILSRS